MGTVLDQPTREVPLSVTTQAATTQSATEAPTTSLPLKSWIFSTDDHLLETSCDFRSRVPAKFADEAPRVVDHEGGDAWLINGTPVPFTFGDAGGRYVLGTQKRPGIRMKLQKELLIGYDFGDEDAEQDQTPAGIRRNQGLVRYAEDFQPGVYDVRARLSDMDADGVWVSVTIPSISFGFAGQRLSMGKDQELGLATVRAYNDWLHEQVAGANPERFVCSAIPWLADPVIGAEEIRKNAARGFTALLFPENPERFGLPSIHSGHWEPMLAACEETGTVLNVHLGTGLQSLRPSSDSPIVVGKSAFSVNSALSAFDLVFSGIPLRYPDIRISFTEGGIDFVPLVYGRLNSLGDEDLLDWKADIRPGEAFLRNFWFAALVDIGAYDFLAKHCPDHMMLETDYPHGDTWWPGSQEYFAERLVNFTDEELSKIALKNAAALYRHEIPNVPTGTIDNRIR
jgi:predicted TIM-barrel fold metal-dependent hydrolase